MRRLKYFLCGRFFPFALAALLLLATGLILIFWLPRLLAPIAALERVLALISAVAVCCDDSPAEFKLPRAVLIVLLPWVGAIACLFFLVGEKEITKETNGNAQQRFPLSVLSENLSALPACAAKTADYFPVGREMYLSLLADLKRAKKFICLEFYIAAEGLFLSDILDILEEKAKSGVDCRLLLDGFGCALTLPSDFQKEAEKRNISVRFFRPLKFPTRSSERRDHRKIAVIDGQIAYTGGVNLADEYIGEKIRFGHWKDTAVRVTGGAAALFCDLFVRTWDSLGPDRPLPRFRHAGGNIPCAVIADSADETSCRAGRSALLKLFAGAERRLYVTTPYLAPDTALMRTLETAALAGVDVRLMIPHIPDKKLPFLLSRSYAAELERSGVKVMEYTDGFLHAKSVVSDDVAFVSSYNLDFRSLYLQSECGIAVKQKAFADRVAADFLSVWEGGTSLPARGKASEIFGRVLRLTAPIF